jgi:uncharacterized membrane protein YccF (DUF307 family)
MLRTIMNIIWLVLSGTWLALGYAVAGIVMFILIITIQLSQLTFRASL